MKGKVDSVAHAISRSKNNNSGAEAYVQPSTNWIRYDYRVPVTIYLDNTSNIENYYSGTDASVVVLK
ncbi:HlyD family secretion protein [Piscirickettsia litoralis]|uniref:p-hydroxybenzoic acid efflux pump subunit AaeA-like beta-barrel domain-containing protein n=1 Tax=Piscirickettsia litoralis TaxID=1891921 RepID=A0ABX2ZXZ6_9GAMM|nr:hypothetical protein [Piscirickettsia litoralis]ODN41491.1 hypothetical protein BGC07_15365 [Piscirickettsia litoralis]